MTADVLRELLLPKLDGVRIQHGYWMAKCPAHDDNQASLSITPGNDQPVLITCHANCDRDEILAKLGLSWADLCKPRSNGSEPHGEWTPYGDAIAVYDYTDENGELLFQVLRAPGKKFIQRRPDSSAKTGWKYQLGDTRRVLYRLPKVLAAITECAVIYVVEGEKDVHSVEAAGSVATCNPHGAGKWRDEFSETLREAIVIIVADKDDPGYAHARMVAASLKGIAAAVEISEAAAGKDVTDHLAAGRKLADLVTIWTEDDPRPDLAPDLKQFLAVVDPPQIFTLGDLLALEEKLMLTGIEGHGKALALDTSIPTPEGWTTMGRLTAGQEVFTADGTPTRVSYVSPVMYGRPCYRVKFSDGAEITADADHLWLTETERERQYRVGGSVRTTAEISETLLSRSYGRWLNHSVICAGPLQYPAQELLIAPWLLGAWLGDGSTAAGHLTVGTADLDYVLTQLDALGEKYRVHHYHDRATRVTVLGLQVRLRAIGVLGRKHIPRCYLEADMDCRLALLRGLMDTDGSVSWRGSGQGRGFGAAICEFSVTCEPLARAVHELLLGLGIKVPFGQGRAMLNGRDVGVRYRLAFQTDLPVAGMPRKANRLTASRTRRASLRYITAAEPVPSVPVRCIQVEHSSALYLAGRECIPTHNTTLLRQIGLSAAVGRFPFTGRRMKPRRVLMIDCENPERQSRAEFRPLVSRAERDGYALADGMFRIIHRRQGIDLCTDEGAAWLAERVTAHDPELLLIGTLWKLHDGDLNEEGNARTLTKALDSAVYQTGCAMIVEAHSPHGEGRFRPTRPAGSAAFLRWPDFGLCLLPDTPTKAEREAGTDDPQRYRLARWRGGRDRLQRWPRKLMPGIPGGWPWVAEAEQDRW